MREDSDSNWGELMEDIGQKSTVVHFEVQASLCRKPHDLSKNKAYVFAEKRVNERVYNFSMTITRMFCKQDLLLDKEVRNIVF